MIDTGRKIISAGSRINRPTSLMTLEKNMKESCNTRAIRCCSGDQLSVALVVKKMMRGSKRTDRDVNVAMCRA